MAQNVLVLAAVWEILEIAKDHMELNNQWL